MRREGTMAQLWTAMLLLCCLGIGTAQYSGHKWSFLGGYNVTNTGMMQEYGYVDTDNEYKYALSGNSRAYLVQNYKAKYWSVASYVRFDLRNRILSFTVDVSKVPCGVLATLYLVRMGNPDGSPNYCDITPKAGGCTEVDIMEANRYAYQATVHTKPGDKSDGTCNVKGCWSNIGKYPYSFTGKKAKDLYGPGAKINTNHPFTVSASFGDDGQMTVKLQQEFEVLTVFDGSLPGNTPDVKKADWNNFAAYPKPQGVSEDANAVIADMFASVGGVLVTTTWTANDTTWLDGGACGDQKRGDVKHAMVTIKDFKVSGPPPPSTSTQTTSTVTTSTFTIPHHQAPPPPPPGLAARLKKDNISPTPKPLKVAAAHTVHAPPPHKPPPPMDLYTVHGRMVALDNESKYRTVLTLAPIGMAAAMVMGTVALAYVVCVRALRANEPGLLPIQQPAQTEVLE